ncbi:MAG: 4-alpha-glucanotransferase, partial [Candidatus Kapaibacterium sp.]
AYTGTHDNNTTLGWWKDLDKRGKRFLREYSGKSSLGRTRRRDVVEEMIRLTIASTANLAIIPIQDLLGLDSDARMNVPGAKSDANWSWRMGSESLDEKLAEEFAELLELFGRGK